VTFLRPWLVGFALLFATIGAVFWILSIRTYGAHDWLPLHVPITLEAGVSVSEEFDTDLDGTYSVILLIRSDLPWESASPPRSSSRNLAALARSWAGSSEVTASVHSIASFTWPGHQWLSLAGWKYRTQGYPEAR